MSVIFSTLIMNALCWIPASLLVKMVYWPHLTWYDYGKYQGMWKTHTHICIRQIGSKRHLVLVILSITSDISIDLNLVECFSFTPTVRIPPPPVLLWHPAHCVHSWEHWPPPLWEWTRGVCSGSLCTPIPQCCPLCVAVRCLSHSKIILSLHLDINLVIYWLCVCTHCSSHSKITLSAHSYCHAPQR